MAAAARFLKSKGVIACQDHDSPGALLANVNETDHGHHLHMSVRAEGAFTITNSRTGFRKDYGAR